MTLHPLPGTARPHLTARTAPPGAPALPEATPVPQAPPDVVDAADPATSEGSRTFAPGRVARGVMAGLAGLAALSGATSYGLAHAPGLPPVLGRIGADTWLPIRGTAEAPSVIRELALSSNRHLEPSRPRTDAISQDGLRVVSFNIHHGRSPDGAGSREQWSHLESELRASDADVLLLQEVQPWEAQRLVDAVGMEGYYSPSTVQHGNMILTHPGLKVTEDSKLVLNHNVPEGDRLAATRALLGQKAREPRTAQMVRLEMESGQTAVVWNTHLTCAEQGQELRLGQVERILQAVDDFARPGEPRLGGGDLNDGATSPAVQRLDEVGAVSGTGLDFLVGQNLPEPVQTQALHPQEPSGVSISDHPMLVTRIEVQAPQD